MPYVIGKSLLPVFNPYGIVLKPENVFYQDLIPTGLLSVLNFRDCSSGAFHAIWGSDLLETHVDRLPSSYIIRKRLFPSLITFHRFAVIRWLINLFIVIQLRQVIQIFIDASF